MQSSVCRVNRESRVLRLGPDHCDGALKCGDVGTVSHWPMAQGAAPIQCIMQFVPSIPDDRQNSIDHSREIEVVQVYILMSPTPSRVTGFAEPVARRG